MSLYFGVGCFHFGVHAGTKNGFSWSDYIEELQQALGSISSVSNIDIMEDVIDDDTEFTMEEPPQLLISGEGGLFPRPDFLEISFEVYIPFRVQAEILKLPVTAVETFTERFRVHIRYTYHMPVAFVQLVNPSQPCQSSEAVKIVREFLDAEMKSDFIRFEFLGPSPFHCEFSLTPKSDPGSHRFGCEIVARRGYDHVRFCYNVTSFTTTEEAFLELIDELEGELGLYYDLVHGELVRRREWQSVSSKVNHLLRIRSDKSVSTLLWRPLRYSRLLNDAFVAVANFESTTLFNTQIEDRDHRDVYQSGGYLRRYVDKEKEERTSYPSGPTRELLLFLEERFSKTAEIAVVLVAAVIGGAVGSLLTSWLGQ